MSNWPLIKQLVSIFSYIFRGLYIALSQMGIESVVVTVAILVLILKLSLFPILYKQQKIPYLRNIAKRDFDKINTINMLNASKEMKVKKNIEIFRTCSKYGIANSSGCLTSLVQIAVFVAFYSVVFNATKYIPESVNNPNAFSFFGIDLSVVPPLNSFSTSVVPLIATVSQFISTYQINYYNSGKTKIGFLHIYSTFLIAFFSLKLQGIISFYWAIQAIITIVENFAIRTILKNKDPQKTMLDYVKKLNKSRTKRGLSQLTVRDLQGA